MNDKILELTAEIEDELRLIQELGIALKVTVRDLPVATRQESVYLESIALKLHNFYTGCERIFTLISQELNGGIPQSQDWHIRLLRKMTLNIDSIRPAVLSRKTASLLDEYRSFRHVVRHIYGFELKLTRMSPLLDNFDNALEAFETDIHSFIAFLKRIDP